MVARNHIISIIINLTRKSKRRFRRTLHECVSKQKGETMDQLSLIDKLDGEMIGNYGFNKFCLMDGDRKRDWITIYNDHDRDDEIGDGEELTFDETELVDFVKKLNTILAGCSIR